MIKSIVSRVYCDILPYIFNLLSLDVTLIDFPFQSQSAQHNFTTTPYSNWAYSKIYRQLRLFHQSSLTGYMRLCVATKHLSVIFQILYKEDTYILIQVCTSMNSESNIHHFFFFVIMTTGIHLNIKTVYFLIYHSTRKNHTILQSV